MDSFHIYKVKEEKSYRGCSTKKLVNNKILCICMMDIIILKKIYQLLTVSVLKKIFTNFLQIRPLHPIFSFKNPEKKIKIY